MQLLIPLHTVPLPPTGFSVNERDTTIVAVLATLQWQHAQLLGVSLDIIVDNYSISFTTGQSGYQVFTSDSFLVPVSVSYNITLHYNLQYRFEIAAVNCVGRSDAAITTFSRLGMYRTSHKGH